MSSEALTALLGGAWVGEDNLSAARMNTKTVWIGTSTNLANLSPTYPGQIAVCTTTGSGFVENAVYFRNSTNDGWLFLSMSKHTHNSDDHLSGGLYVDIIYDNAMNYWYYDNMAPRANDFLHSLGGLGTVVDSITASTGKLQIDTGIVANDYAQIVLHGVKFSFAHKSRYMTKMGVTFSGGGVTNYIVRSGVGAEDVNASNTTSNKYGIEACSQDSQVNWMIFSANAGVRTGGTVTSSPVEAGYDFNGKGYRLDHTPNVNIKFYDDGVNCGANCTKTSNNPNSGNTGNGFLMRIGIKSTNTTAKKVALFGIRLVGQVGDTTWA